MLKIAFPDSTQAFLAGAASISSATAAVTAHDLISEQWLGVPLAVFLAAFAGSSFSLMLLNELSLRKSISTVFSSTGMAVFAVSILSWKFDIPPSPSIGVAGLLGLFGQTILGAALGALPDAVKGFLQAAVERVRGR